MEQTELGADNTASVSLLKDSPTVSLATGPPDPSAASEGTRSSTYSGFIQTDVLNSQYSR